MYKVVSFISGIIRLVYLPNPYVNIIGDEVCAEIFNIFGGDLLLHYLSLFLIKMWYVQENGEEANGSLGYLINYCYLTLLITKLGNVISNVGLFIIMFVFIYILSCIIERKLFGSGV